jgi:phosphate transport system permease protein
MPAVATSGRRRHDGRPQRDAPVIADAIASRPVSRRLPVWSDRAFTITAWTLGAAGLALPLSIIGFLVVGGLPVVDWAFLSSGPKGFPLGMQGGILPAIKGSLALGAIGLVLATPAAVGGAVYLAEYCERPWLLRSIRFVTECLAGTPSIVYGLFSYAFLVVFLDLKVSLSAGAITLAILMFPQILVGAHEALLSVDRAHKEAALAMGVTRAYLVRKIVLPNAWPGIVAVTVLSAGHAVGSAAPVLYTASVILAVGGLDLGSPVMTLPTHLYYLVGEAISFEHAYGTALVMVVGLLFVNTLAMLIKRLIRI